MPLKHIFKKTRQKDQKTPSKRSEISTQSTLQIVRAGLNPSIIAALSASANPLLNSEAYRYAYAGVYVALQDRWAAESDSDSRELLHAQIRALGAIDNELRLFISQHEGNLALDEAESADNFTD